MTSANQNQESPEAELNKVKKDSGTLYSQLIKKYVGEKLKNKSERFSFVKNLAGESGISAELLVDIKKFAGKDELFDGLELTEQKLQISAFQRETALYMLNIQNKYVKLRSLFLQEYNIENSVYDDTLLGEIESIKSEGELNKLITSFDARKKLIKDTIPKNTPVLRDMSQFLKGFDIEKKYNKISDDKKVGFYMTVQKMQKGQKIDPPDVWELLESGVFSVSETQKLIEIFIPTITLKKATEIGLFSSVGAKKLKKEALKKTINTEFLSSESELDIYVDQMDDADLIFSTANVFSNKQKQDKLIDTNFFADEFVSQYNTMIQDLEQNLEKKSIQTVSEVIEELKKHTHISGASLFGVGSTLVITQKIQNASGKKEDVRIFAEISSLSDKGYFTLTEKGSQEYDDTIKKISRLNYSDFLKYITQGNSSTVAEKVEIISPTELKKRIVAKEIVDVHQSIQLTDKTELSSEISKITQKIDARKRVLTDAGVSKAEREKDPELQNLYAERDELNNSLSGIDILNTTVLKKKISELDSSGDVFGIEAGTTFEVGKGKKLDAFTITHVDEVNQSITLRGVGKPETLSYASFLENFERQQAKRVSNIKNFESLFLQGDKSYESWGKYELTDGKIRKKGIKGKYNYDFLVSPEGGEKEMIKIHSIDGANVVVSFGEVKDIKEKKDDHHGDSHDHGHHDATPKQQKQVFSMESKTYTISLGVLDNYIRIGALGPRTIDDHKVKEEEASSIPKNPTQWSFMSAFFKGMSIAELISGGNMFIEHYGKMLEEGSEHKAGHFALHTLGRFLPEEARIDFQSRIEAHEKHEMDDHLERLKGISSEAATKNIENWLKDPNCPEYKKEAGLMYMMGKYGALCAKGSLYPYKGQYFWYQALGGSVNPPDTVFVEVTAANEKLNLNTTEEELVYRLIKKQSSGHGYTNQKGTIHRRSKLDKELKAVRGQGKKEEVQTGRDDGSAERDVMKRLEGGLSELSSGNYPNAIGWLEEIVNKGGPMEVMNKIPFVMMFSGMAYEFEQDTTDILKNFPGESRMLPMLRFISYQRDIDLVNDTILEICKNLNARGGDYAGILTQAQSVYGNQKSKSVSEKSKQEAAISLYDGHGGLWGKAITDTLYMLNTGNDEDTINKMVFFEKDNKVDDNGREIPGTGNEVFKRYYEKLHGYLRDDGNFGKSEELMSDAFKYAGTSGMDMYRASSQLFLMKMGTFAKGDAAQFMWTEIRRELEAIPRRTYDSNPARNKKMQEKILEENLRFFIAGIMENHNDPRGLGYFNAPNSATNKLNTWGIYLSDFISERANRDSILSGGHSSIIQRFTKNIMESEQLGRNFDRPVKYNEETGGYKLLDDASHSQIGIGDIVSGQMQRIMNNSANDNQVKNPNSETMYHIDDLAA